VTAPPSVAADIRFDPSLPEERSQLMKVSVGGTELKQSIVYDEPFWREAGLSGQTVEVGSPAEFTIDASPASGRPGIIANFVFADTAAHLYSLDAAERRLIVLDSLARRLGPRAAQPADYVETAWWTEEWSRGCSMAYLPPGALTQYGPLMREPVGRIHWAGTETATVSHGAIDGAVRSGYRAVDEILALD
jgi:monoamine oxidase